MKKTLKYIPKLIVNGQEIEQQAKQIVCNIKDVEVTLNCTYITDLELKDAYTSSFTTSVHDKTITVTYAKVSNRVSATVYINNIIAFSSLSMQAVFTVLSTAYGLSKSTLNNMYIKSNTMRKQATKSVSNLRVNNTFEF